MMKSMLIGMAAVAGAVELTSDNWEASTAGKTVFIKFFAPWCGHCKAMKPDWDELMDEYEGHASILVADVDCVGEGAKLCEGLDIEGFPTLKYGNPNDMEDYEADRELEALEKFTKNLKPGCSPFNVEACDEAGKAAIQAMEALSDEELSAQVTIGAAAMTAAEEAFGIAFENLQAEYEVIEKTKTDAIAEVKAGGMGMAKTVLAARALARSKSEDKSEDKTEL